jgi:hypothetical protein
MAAHSAFFSGGIQQNDGQQCNSKIKRWTKNKNHMTVKLPRNVQNGHKQIIPWRFIIKMTLGRPPDTLNYNKPRLLGTAMPGRV